MHPWHGRDDAAPVPDRPRLKPWYRVVEAGEALVLEHGQTAVVFEGRAARRLLPTLLPLLDGTRPTETIIEELGAGSAGGVEHALVVLHEHGLLLDGPGLDPREPADVVEAVQLLSSVASGSEPEAVRRTLAGAVVEVLGEGGIVPLLVEVLRGSGVGSVDRVGWDIDAESIERRLVVAAPSGREGGDIVGWNRRAVDGGQVWLQVLPFDGRFAAIGPLFVPGETCCFECYRLRRLAACGYAAEFRAIEDAHVVAPAGPALNATIAGVAASLVLRWLAHGDHHLPGCFHACEGAGTALSQHRVYRVPRCPVCSDIGDVAPPLPWYKETAAEIVP